MLNEVDDLPIVAVDNSYYNLLPSRFPPVALYARIAKGRDEEFSHIEGLTNPRLKEKNLLTHGSTAVDESSPRYQNWNHAPFTYPNPEGSWFFDHNVGCLELSGDIQTALAVSVAKREQFLSRTNEGPIDLDMRMLMRRVEGRFLDARNLPIDVPKSVHRATGKAILERRANTNFSGVIFMSPERPSGEQVAVLTGEVLDRAVQSKHFRYTWDGTRVCCLYSFDNRRSDEENQIDPEMLRGEHDILAA